MTPYFYTRPKKFGLGQAKNEKTYPKYRLTVDTPEGFRIIKIFASTFDTSDIRFHFGRYMG
jgi:spore coat polysaccharide biosynthesis protein SpsF (cytidylyltransferase family)